MSTTTSKGSSRQAHTATPLKRVALIGNYPPRQCGIATFTADVLEAVRQASPATECFAVPMTDTSEGYRYPEAVRFEIQQNDLTSYRFAADFLNFSHIDIACLQHEFGIFGGPAGSHLLTLVDALKVPLVTVLHSILREPDVHQFAVMKRLTAASDRLVVMSRTGAEILSEVYSVPDAQIEYIPHGIPDVPFIDPIFYKDKFSLEGKQVVLTFGLLSAGKGIEYVIRALPAVVERHPDVVFVVLGATHPNVKKHEGEAYRLSLHALAAELDIEKHVIFYNRYVDLDELLEFIGAADVYITPYLNEAQITSGTLAYATGMGKAVISTPYWHARELLADGRGLLTPFADADATAEAINRVLEDKPLSHQMRKRSYALGRDMTWPVVGARYVECFRSVILERNASPRCAISASPLHARPRDLLKVDLQHLERLTDDTGLLQHATYLVPDYQSGYTTDDNARGLLLTMLLEDNGQQLRQSRQLSVRYLAFLLNAFNTSSGRFRNFMAYDRRWLEETGSEDSHGRAMWALGTVVGRARLEAHRGLATHLFYQALPALEATTSPRTWAFALLGCNEYLSHFSGDLKAQQMRDLLARRLLQSLRNYATADWPWFENSLSYANAVLPHALMVGGHAMDNQEMVTGAFDALEWLADIQNMSGRCFSPIGSNGFYHKGGRRARFDQQPIEAQAMVSACLQAFRISAAPQWRVRARLAYDWFLGKNDLGAPLYDSQSGSGRDGLHVDRVNENRGAEATLAFLQSLAEMHAMQYNDGVKYIQQLIPGIDVPLLPAK